MVASETDAFGVEGRVATFATLAVDAFLLSAVDLTGVENPRVLETDILGLAGAVTSALSDPSCWSQVAAGVLLLGGVDTWELSVIT